MIWEVEVRHKFVVLIIIVLCQFSFAQSEFVDANDKVYRFLDRMSSNHIIKHYNSFEIPITRKKVTGYLKDILMNKEKLNNEDIALLNYFANKYAFDLSDDISSVISIGKSHYDFFSEKERFLYAFSKKDTLNLFINLIAKGNYVFSNREITGEGISYNGLLGIYGGEIRGTILNRIGFHLYGDNGTLRGDKGISESIEELKYNFKFNEKDDESFFDKTYGYLNIDFDFVRFKIGNDYRKIGYGRLSPIVNDPFVGLSYFDFKIDFSFFTYSFVHSKLMGDYKSNSDSIQGKIVTIDDKYLAYHRLGFDIAPHFNFGFGEMIIYSRRGIDLSYVNPFSFYKTVEHQNQDRDNALLFVDFENRSIEGVKFFGTYLIDDINFGKEKEWWGNQTFLHLGTSIYQLNKSIPLDLHFEYVRISPYTFTHRINSNNFMNSTYPLGGGLVPNSELFFVEINYRLRSRFDLVFQYQYQEHGSNIIDEMGNITNYGGDIKLGHRVSDSEKSGFLDGFREYFRKFSLILNYEPFNNVLLSIGAHNENNFVYTFSPKSYNEGHVKKWYIENKLIIKI